MPYTVIKHYIHRTQSLRDKSKTQLLIGQIKPHNEVCKTTIAGWLKLLLQKAGIDITTFSAHSYRAASTSKAFLSGASIDDILKAGNWSSKSVWQQFYQKPIMKNQKLFQDKVLTSNTLSRRTQNTGPLEISSGHGSLEMNS